MSQVTQTPTNRSTHCIPILLCVVVRTREKKEIFISHVPTITSHFYAIAATTKSQTSCFSARTLSSIVTPVPLEYVIRQRARTFPPPPVAKPESWRVCTLSEVGVSEPPRGSMWRTSIIESQAAVDRCQWVRFGRCLKTWNGEPLRLSMAPSKNVSVALGADRILSHSEPKLA